MKLPEPWSLWKNNTSGKLYRVLMITNEKATRKNWEVTVSYEDIYGGRWSRPVALFMANNTEEAES